MIVLFKGAFKIYAFSSKLSKTKHNHSFFCSKLKEERLKLMLGLNRLNVVLLVGLLFLVACRPSGSEKNVDVEIYNDSTENVSLIEEEELKEILPGDIVIEKNLLYDQYTLEDKYPYKDTVRVFQWDKIRNEVAKVENAQRKPTAWGVVKNRKNVNGESPLVKKFYRNSYKNISDTLGTERYQSVPLYLLNDTITPEIYATDGTLFRFIEYNKDSSFVHVSHVYGEGEWLIPSKYMKYIDTINFKRIAVVDRTNQNITTLEKDSASAKWLVRSQNPATTGAHNPPYQKETPLGIFVVQEKKQKMYFLVDGTSRIAGYTPWASRFTNGGYIHGVPVNYPRQSIIEYSATLGTIPRSHMCVRNASSHAKFVYDWAAVEESLVIVIE